MKWTALFSGLLVFMVFTVVLAFGQRPVMPLGIGPFGALPGAIQASAPQAGLPTTWPQWFTAGAEAFTPDTGLVFHSAVYDPANKVMMAFGGLDRGAEETGTNAVLLYTPANSASAKFTTLIPNGALGSPPARVGHNAVYDAADNIISFSAAVPASPAGLRAQRLLPTTTYGF